MLYGMMAVVDISHSEMVSVRYHITTIVNVPTVAFLPRLHFDPEDDPWGYRHTALIDSLLRGKKKPSKPWTQIPGFSLDVPLVLNRATRLAPVTRPERRGLRCN